MAKPTKKTTNRMRRAAHLLVRGASWEQVATRLGYKTEDTAREELACKHPRAWRKQYELARGIHDDQMVAEADRVQRELLRQQIVRCDWQGEPIEGENGQALTIEHSPQTRQSAANSIKTHAARGRTQRTGGTPEADVPADPYLVAKQAGLLEDDGTGETYTG